MMHLKYLGKITYLLFSDGVHIASKFSVFPVENE